MEDRLETDQELLDRAKPYCVACDDSFPFETQRQTLLRMRTRGNWCARCNSKAQADSKNR